MAPGSTRLVIDTDVLIDYLRGQEQAAGFLEGCEQALAISVITIAELYAGVRDGAERQQATQSREASARSIGRSPTWRIQVAIDSRADPSSSARFRPPSDTQDRNRGARSAGIRWQTSVNTGQVDTKAP